MVWLKNKNENMPSNSYDSLRGLTNLSHNPMNRTTFIKRVEFTSVHQVDDIKESLNNGNILILDASELLENTRENLMELKRAIDNIRRYCEYIGGSIGRIGDQMMILTPNPYIKIR